MFLGTQELFLNRALSSKEHFKTIDTNLELKDTSNMLQHSKTLTRFASNASRRHLFFNIYKVLNQCKFKIQHHPVGNCLEGKNFNETWCQRQKSYFDLVSTEIRTSGHYIILLLLFNFASATNI